MLRGFWREAPRVAGAHLDAIDDGGHWLSRYPVPADADPAEVYGAHLTQVRLAVQDQGIGIAAEDQARLFPDFRQSDEGRTKAHPGTGMDLALVRRLVGAAGARPRPEPASRSAGPDRHAHGPGLRSGKGQIDAELRAQGKRQEQQSRQQQDEDNDHLPGRPEHAALRLSASLTFRLVVVPLDCEEHADPQHNEFECNEDGRHPFHDVDVPEK